VVAVCAFKRRGGEKRVREKKVPSGTNVESGAELETGAESAEQKSA